MHLALFGTLVLLFILRMPVAFCLGLSSLVYLLLFQPVPPIIIAQKMFTSIDSFPLTAIPFFILAGGLMETGGISRRLIDFANNLVGFITGGLAHVSIVASMFFAGISGAAAADTAAVGSVLIPAMSRRGYHLSFSAALQACAGTIGVMIPPSIPLIFYGVLASASISRLFLGGAIPGVIMGLTLMGVAYLMSRKRGYPREEFQGWRQLAVSFRRSSLALLMPVVVLGGIIFGVVTPTEAAVLAVVYALLLGLVIYRELNVRRLYPIFVQAMINSTQVMFIISVASVFAWIITRELIPQQVAGLLGQVSTNPWVIMLIINVLLLIVGTFLDIGSSLIIFVPVLMPIVAKLGIDPVYFGVIMVVNLAIGMVTPPLGVCLFVACGIAGIDLETIARDLWPFLIGMIGVLFLITYVPGLVTWLPGFLK
ncbi:MAG: TRAP transporter large permease [Thermodesulfobacteriota bacterium]